MSATPGDEPRLWLPRPPLRDYIEYFGYWQRASGEPHRSRALPRGAATVVIDISGREHVDLYTGDGRTLLPVPAAFVTGAGTTSYVTRIDPAQAVVTIHFRPAGALPFLGVPLGELENSCVGLEDLPGMDSAALRERLIAATSAASRIALVESFLLQRLQIGAREPHRVVTAVLNAIEHDPSMRVSQAHRMTGLSPRRLTTAFRAEVGLAPKAFSAYAGYRQPSACWLPGRRGGPR